MLQGGQPEWVANCISNAHTDIHKLFVQPDFNMTCETVYLTLRKCTHIVSVRVFVKTWTSSTLGYRNHCDWSESCLHACEHWRKQFMYTSLGSTLLTDKFSLGECIVVIYMNKKTRGWVCTVFSTWYIAVGMWWGVCWWTSACRRWGNWLHSKKQTKMLTQTRFKNSFVVWCYVKQCIQSSGYSKSINKLRKGREEERRE